MNLKYLSLLCLTGLFSVIVPILGFVPDKYVLMMTKVTWPVAQNYCRVKYHDLATIVTNADWQKLNNEATRKGMTTYAWIGLYNDFYSWRWSLNELPMKSVPFTSWGSGDPNFNSENGSCVFINQGAIWWDTSCADKRPFMCYNANFSGSDRFIFVSTPLLSWTDAQTYCRTYHTDLASSLNSLDNNILASTLTTSDYPWIGLHRDTWKWSDGTTASNLLWGSRQPDNFGGVEHCVVLFQGSFIDVPCNDNYDFYCETKMRKQQIVKLQVMSEGSEFDANVQSSILEQIKQKLEEKGMLENSTVTWRVQADGNIFYKKKKDEL